MIVNGVIISKDKSKYQIGKGLKELVKKASGLTNTKGSGLTNVKNTDLNKKTIFYYNI